MNLNFEVVPVTEITSPPDTEEYRPIVLVVDDESVIADTLAIILSKSGFAPIAAYEGKSALEMSMVIQPDLFLSDIAMPGMSGVELAIEITETIPGCRVLLFSGQSPALDLLSEARAMGYEYPVLAKPVHPSVLLASIAKCLEDSADFSIAMPEPIGGATDQLYSSPS